MRPAAAPSAEPRHPGKNERVTFLAPITGLTAAAIATPILLLYYFLKLRRRPVRISSTLLWERAVRDLEVNTPFRWLRPSWLLFMQLLALASLCLALARPAIEAPEQTANRLILLIDASASMNARDARLERESENANETSAPSSSAPPTKNSRLDRAVPPGASRLDAAKREALKLIARLDEYSGGSGTAASAAVVWFAAAPRAMTGFTSSAAELRRAINSIEPTDQPGDLPAALKLAHAMAQQSSRDNRTPGAGPAATARIMLIGDGGGGADELGGLGRADFRFIRVGPAPDEPLDNLGVVALSARRDMDDPAKVRLFARVQNTSRSPVTTTITLRLDDTPLRTREITIPPRSDDAPGENATVFEFLDAPSGRAKLATVALLRRDALPSDNAAAIRLEPAIPPRTLIVTPPTISEGARLAHELLVKAVAAVGSRIIDTIDSARFNALEATPGALDRYDLLILDGGRVSWLPAIPTISFGAELDPEIQTANTSEVANGVPVSRIKPDRQTPEAPFGIASWQRSHPILRQVSLDGVVIAQRAAMLDTGDSASQRGRTENLAAAPDGPIITLARRAGADRLSVGFELVQSNWPVQLSFVVFLTNALEHLTHMIGESAGVAYTTTETVAIRAAPGATQIDVTGPMNFSRARQGDDLIRLGALPLAGVYRVQGAIETDQVVPVNVLNEEESSILTRNEVRIAGRATTASSVAAGAPREIWRWFVLAALAVLAAEWMLHAWRMRA